MEQTPSLSVAYRIRLELVAAGVTQSELAQRLGVSHSWVHRRMRGVSPLTLEDVEAIAGAIGVEDWRSLVLAAA